MSLHTWCHHHPRDPSSCATFMFKPHWGRAATGKKKKKIIASMQVGDTLGSLANAQLFATLWTVACQASLLRGSPGKNTGGYWPILVAIPF